jgi:hypothetical protein
LDGKETLDGLEDPRTPLYEKAELLLQRWNESKHKKTIKRDDYLGISEKQYNPYR